MKDHMPKELKIRWYAASGKMERPNNEDFFLARESEQLYIVADGMGGYEGGEFAARFVPLLAQNIIKTMDLLIRQSPDDTISPYGSDLNYESLLRNAFFETHEHTIKESKNMMAEGMGCTIVLLLFRGDRLYIMNAGDCRCYQYSEESLRQITRDHSRVETLLREKKITKEEARVHPERNVVSAWIGGKRFSGKADTYVIPYYVNDRYVLCTDGVTKILDDKEIEYYARDKKLKSSVDNMISAIRAAPADISPQTGKIRRKDNATAMIVEVLAVPSKDGEEASPDEESIII